MNGAARLLFLAGESGTGKTTLGRSLKAHGLLLCADQITKRAGPHYFPNRQENFCRWSLWTAELAHESNHERLLNAFVQSMRERPGPSITDGKNLIIEGAVVGHPDFRKLMLAVLTTEYSVRFHDSDVATYWLDPPPRQVLYNVKSRRRPQERKLTMENIEARLAHYAAMMTEQCVTRLQSSATCHDAALAFLTDGIGQRRS